MSTKVVTGEVRFSYLNVFEPKAPQGGGEPKYSVTLLIPKSDAKTVGKIKAAIAEARKVFCSRHGESALPAKPNHTLHDGDGTRDSGDPYGPECKGHYVITVSSKIKPKVFDCNGNNMLDQSEIFSGCYGKASINFYGYNANGKKGISAGLLGIMMTREGEPFGVSCSADDFADGDDSDFMS